MKKYKEYFTEDLNRVLQEPDETTAAEAKKLGLKYIGFGKYEDKSGQVTHTVVNGRLVPIDKAVKSNSFQSGAGTEGDSLGKDFSKESAQTHSTLVSTYVPDAYSGEELDAIKYFSSGMGPEINKVVGQVPIGSSPGHIEVSDEGGEDLTQTIVNLDTALEKGQTPIDFFTYVVLGSGFMPKEISPGQTIGFKGFRSTTINIQNVLNQSAGPQTTVLQILVKAGSKGMYIDDYSVAMGEQEFILPRGSVITVNGGPNKISIDQSEILFYDCELMNE